MKLYAIRDRLISYYLQPFCSSSDKAVLAGISELLNHGDQHAISQAPQHFEIWSLAEIDEENGKVTPRLEFLADCSSLVRTRVRNPAGQRGSDPENEGPTDSRRGPSGGERTNPDADEPTYENAPPTAPRAAETARQGSAGIPAGPHGN